MTSLDQQLPAETLSAIEDIGADATFHVTSGPVYDAVEGIATIPSTTRVTRKVTPPAAYSLRLINGDSIRAGDAYVLVAGSGLTFAPVIGMVIDTAGARWRVVEVRPIYSGTLVAAYELQLRRG